MTWGSDEHSYYVDGVQVGVAFERKRICQLLQDWGYESREENNCRDDSIALELIELIRGKK
jgi:hypothetical protein